MPRKASKDALTLFDALVYTCLYRVSLDPPSAAQAWVMQARHQLRDRIGDFAGFYRLPGIQLLEADLPPEYERPLSDSVSRAVAGLPGFTLRLEGLAHTPDRRRIYIEVAAPGALAIMRQRIGDHVRANRRIKKLGVEVADRAELVVADGLKAAQFEEAWALLGREPFTAEHRVQDVVILKREWADTSLDEHVCNIPLLLGR